MDEGRKRRMLVGAMVCIIVLAVGLTVARSCSGGDYARDDLGLDAPDAREATAVVNALADGPEQAADQMSSTARANALQAVREAAQAMAELGNAEPVAASWFGGYMRLTVSCERTGAEPLELRFFLVREDGELRITGMQK